MTYEDFIKRAQEPVEALVSSIYKVEVFRIIDNNRLETLLNILELGKSSNTLKKMESQSICYPEFNVHKTDCFIFTTFEAAQQFITSDKLSYIDHLPIYSMIIRELPLGKDVFSNCSRREWRYDKNGNLIIQSSCSSLLDDLEKREGHFWGRLKDNIPFKPGDIVETFDRESGIVKLAIENHYKMMSTTVGKSI